MIHVEKQAAHHDLSCLYFLNIGLFIDVRPKGLDGRRLKIATTELRLSFFSIACRVNIRGKPEVLGLFLTFILFLDVYSGMTNCKRVPSPRE